LLTRVFDTFEVPLDDKEGKEPVKIDFLEETFLTMCQLKGIDGMWRLGTGKERRRDVDEAPAENVENVEVNEGEEFQQDFDWEQVEEDAKFRGKNKLKKKLKFRGNQERKGLQWNIQDHGVDPWGHLPDYESIHLATEFA
ncbi:hypothetical protein Dimus_021969, partial [Dionaea muscipula]